MYILLSKDGNLEIACQCDEVGNFAEHRDLRQYCTAATKTSSSSAATATTNK